MNLHSPTLLFVCTAVLLLAAGVMTWFGARQRCYRGYWCWVAAQWLLSLGLGLQIAAPRSDLVLAAAHLLVLQWPVFVLTGLRRFYSRHGLPVHGVVDLALLGLAWLGLALALQTQASVSAQLIAWSAGPSLLLAYAGLLVTRLTEFKGSAALQLLAIAMGAASLANLYRLVDASGAPSLPEEALLAGSASMLLPALVLVHAVLMLSFQRTEHTWTAEHRKLRYLADMDVVTRVANRRHFQELVADALVNFKSEHSSVMTFDIDHFKRINEMFGHATGDDALRQVSQCMQDTLREMDVAGRLGGDEFACFLPDTLPKGAMAVASRMVSNLAAHQVAPRIAPLSLSFGIVQMHEGELVADALRRAEQALFEAKRQGRSRIVVATGPSDKPVFTNSRTLGLFGA
jgi:diguanylate cyclase